MNSYQPLPKYRLLILSLVCGILYSIQGISQEKFPPLQLKHKDRIVFLGGSLFENELANGYLEFAIASRWPDADLVFRNLGWTGDNVFGEARSTFSSPPTAYQQLFLQLRAADPDYVFVSYGAIESQEGKEGLDKFRKGFQTILDSIDAIGAQTIILSTIPAGFAGSEENTRNLNQNLKTYSDALSEIASQRRKRFLDLYNPLSEEKSNLYNENGIHLSPAGYYFLAKTFEQSLGWSARGKNILIRTGKTGTSVTEPGKLISDTDNKIRFSVDAGLLPLPVPVNGKVDPAESITFRITGLKKGIYALTENGKQLITAAAADWENGITPDHGVSFAQAEQVAEYIVKKNDLFFQQYRPLNRTYILGFRAYEQGRHKQGLEDLNFIITWLEGQINHHRKPGIKIYELTPMKSK